MKGFKRLKYMSEFKRCDKVEKSILYMNKKESMPRQKYMQNVMWINLQKKTKILQKNCRDLWKEHCKGPDHSN